MSETVTAGVTESQAELPLVTQTTPKQAPKRFELPADAAKADAGGGEPAQNIADKATAPVSDGETSQEEPKVEELTPEQAAERDRKREGRRIEKKLGTAYRRAAEAQARAELAEKQLAEARQAQQAPKVEGEPTLEQFGYDPEKYAQAKADFVKKQTEKEFETKQRTESQQQAQKKLLSSWEEKADRGADKYDDWEEKVGTLQPHAPWVAALMEADNGDDVAYYLGTHPKEAMRISQLPPGAQYREIGKLEATLLKPVEKPKVPSKAPAPIKPLTGTSPVVSDAPSESDDMAIWMRKRQKQVHGRPR